ncbi:flavin reductase family protein [Nocardioides sp. GY 10127]|uniref:flavin reductase family protein n=1 Tax=Nocardioides sp. GY 10127 TaxID=2569762 RepID=UPI0010A7D2CF|nr:flavin reductase family protein [Nocardioides sp. GY 10127]TIC79981.1 flavin reductase family protein [Nocardioides sp. GY 10127]
MFYAPGERDRTRLPHDPFKALVAPRPIGWISTRGLDGSVNLAPYSFFNAVCDSPPMVLFSSTGRKDTLTYALERGEFTWNLATRALAEAMNETCAPLPRGVSEFERAGLALAEGVAVETPRVAASPASLECVVVGHERLRDRHGRDLDQWTVTGEVVGVHLDEGLLTPDGRFDTRAAAPLMRAGYRDEYLVADTPLAMLRPEL